LILGVESVTEAEAIETLNILLKYQSDIAKASKELQGDGGAKKPGVPRTS
jgi:hypothetical protein